MNIMVFDTETTDINKPFCYNIGYVIVNLDTGKTLKKADFVVEQVWHNPMLFATAYYADKRPDYVSAMRAKTTKLNKYGYICQSMIRDFKAYNVEMAFAYNSPFDERVFSFNCNWFKCNNPFDNIPVYDIRGYAHHYLCNSDYKRWCEEHEKFSESGNYSTTAEAVYQYISGKDDFIEAHTALADSEIEAEILIACLLNGAKIDGDYKPFRSLTREVDREFTVKFNDEIVLQKTVKNIRYLKKNNTIILRE